MATATMSPTMGGRIAIPPYNNSSLQRGWNHFAVDQVVEALPLADNVIPVAVHQHFGWLGMGIVIGGHGEPVSPDAHDRQEIAALRPVDPSVLGEEDAAP